MFRNRSSYACPTACRSACINGSYYNETHTIIQRNWSTHLGFHWIHVRKHSMNRSGKRTTSVYQIRKKAYSMQAYRHTLKLDYIEHSHIFDRLKYVVFRFFVLHFFFSHNHLLEDFLWFQKIYTSSCSNWIQFEFCMRISLRSFSPMHICSVCNAYFKHWNVGNLHLCIISIWIVILTNIHDLLIQFYI